MRHGDNEEQRELAILRARLLDAQRTVTRLRNCLRVIRDCTEKRCCLCLRCLEAANMDEE